MSWEVFLVGALGLRNESRSEDRAEKGRLASIALSARASVADPLAVAFVRGLSPRHSRSLSPSSEARTEKQQQDLQLWTHLWATEGRTTDVGGLDERGVCARKNTVTVTVTNSHTVPAHSLGTLHF